MSSLTQSAERTLSVSIYKSLTGNVYFTKGSIYAITYIRYIHVKNIYKHSFELVQLALYHKYNPAKKCFCKIFIFFLDLVPVWPYWQLTIHTIIWYRDKVVQFKVTGHSKKKKICGDSPISTRLFCCITCTYKRPSLWLFRFKIFTICPLFEYFW